MRLLSGLFEMILALILPELIVPYQGSGGDTLLLNESHLLNEFDREFRRLDVRGYVR